MKITESQRKATAAFHLRMAEVLRQAGKEKDAKNAEQAAKIVLCGSGTCPGCVNCGRGQSNR